jgi:hypothetical protein
MNYDTQKCYLEDDLWIDFSALQEIDLYIIRKYVEMGAEGEIEAFVGIKI